jgi:acyl-CoA synthetase (AMP-forming)/AMP-acid ligase II/acyl carrier protein
MSREAVEWDIVSVPRTLSQLVETRAQEQPSAKAIAAPGRRPLTYRGLSFRIKVIGHTLAGHGIGRNDPVAILLPDGPEMAVALLSVATVASAAPLNPAFRTRECEFFLSSLEAKALILTPGLETPARAVAESLGIPVLDLEPVSDEAAGVFRLGSDRISPAGGTLGLTEPEDTAILLHTSGTTAGPKLVPIRQSSLCLSAHFIRTPLQLGPDDRSLIIMPLFHMHGLELVVTMLLARGMAICTPGFDPARFFDWVDEFDPTFYSAVPTIHQAILAEADRSRDILSRWSPRFIRSSSAPLSRRVRIGLETRLKATVVENYGCTETMQSTCNPVDRCKSGTVGIPVGSEVRIINESGQSLPSGERGEIAVKGPCVMKGYKNNPEASAAAFIDGWLRTGDEGYLDDEGYLVLTGRLNEKINRGGEKISPGEVDEVLMSHLDVLQVATFPVPHSSLGEDVAAAVVRARDSKVTNSELRAFAEAHLAPFKVPRQIVFVEAIPKGSTGKLLRAGLAESLGLTGPRAAERRSHKATRQPTALEQEILLVWQRTLGLNEIDINDNFFFLGGNSLLAMQVVSRLGQRLGLTVPAGAIFESPTVASLALTVVQLRAETQTPERVSRILAEIEALDDEDASQMLANMESEAEPD